MRLARVNKLQISVSQSGNLTASDSFEFGPSISSKSGMAANSSSDVAAAVDIATLEAYFASRTSCADACLALAEDGDPEATAATLNSARLELAGIKRGIKESREEIARWKEMIAKATFLSGFLSKASLSFSSISEEMSKHPRLVAINKERDDSNLVKSVPQSKTNSSTGLSGGNVIRNKSSPGIAKVTYLTVTEFDGVPKYMRGRLQYEGINSAIDEYNRALETKYNFIFKGFQAMASIKDKEMYKKMKALETRDTKGFHFLVGEDFKVSPSLKSESNRRTIFTILRHCQRIREIRGPGAILRYAALSHDVL